MTKPYLIDGPLMLACERRKAVLERMARDLVAYPEGLASDEAATRVLRQLGYPMVDIAILAGEGRMLAFQTIVAREMSEP